MAEEKVTNAGADVTIAIVVFLVLFTLLGAYVATALDWYQALLEWWYEKDWSSVLRTLSIIFIILDVFLLVFSVMVLMRHKRLEDMSREEVIVHPIPLENRVGDTWREIQELANSENPSNWSMAVIRADGLLDGVLKEMGYEGESMAERLKIVNPAELPSIERVWSAHRLRNTIVHGPLEEHTKETITYALRVYETALRELEVYRS